MFDFAGNPHQRIVGDVHARGASSARSATDPRPCEVRLADGTRLVDGRRLTGFTNAEELFLIETARTLFPYLLQDRLVRRRALRGPLYPTIRRRRPSRLPGRTRGRRSVAEECDPRSATTGAARPHRRNRRAVARHLPRRRHRLARRARRNWARPTVACCSCMRWSPYQWNLRDSWRHGSRGPGTTACSGGRPGSCAEPGRSLRCGRGSRPIETVPAREVRNRASANARSLTFVQVASQAAGSNRTVVRAGSGR